MKDVTLEEYCSGLTGDRERVIAAELLEMFFKHKMDDCKDGSDWVYLKHDIEWLEYLCGKRTEFEADPVSVFERDMPRTKEECNRYYLTEPVYSRPALVQLSLLNGMWDALAADKDLRDRFVSLCKELSAVINGRLSEYYLSKGGKDDNNNEGVQDIQG